MPPRPYTLLIVAFWAATTGWLVYEDLWPRLQPGEPPPFTIDLADEASASVQKSFWTIYRDGDDAGSLETSVKYHDEDDTFEIPSTLKLKLGLKLPFLLTEDVEIRIDSTYRVTREGELRELSADGQIRRWDVYGHLEGAIKNGLFVRLFEVKGPAGFEFKPELSPVPISRRGSIFNPNQPVNKLRGLRPGQRWRVPEVDPVADIVKAAASNAIPGFSLPDPPVLMAEVLPALQILPRLELKPPPGGRALPVRRSGVPCLVIQYTSDNISARTWVRESDGLVLRQEATQHGDTWILDRD
jgi:hypothetical protein